MGSTHTLVLGNKVGVGKCFQKRICAVQMNEDEKVVGLRSHHAVGYRLKW